MLIPLGPGLVNTDTMLMYAVPGLIGVAINYWLEETDKGKQFKVTNQHNGLGKAISGLMSGGSNEFENEADRKQKEREAKKAKLRGGSGGGKSMTTHIVLFVLVLIVALGASTEEPPRKSKTADEDAGDEGYAKTQEGKADVAVESENENDVPKASSLDSQKRDTGNAGDTHLTDAGVSDLSCPVELQDKDPEECEVCVEVLKNAMALITKESNKKHGPKIGKAIGRHCKSKLISTEKKMCYYFEPMKKAVAMPLSMGMDFPKVCKKLSKDNEEICTTMYRRTV